MPAPMHVIGLMSGTSLDGIDAVIVEFDSAGQSHCQAHHHQHFPKALTQQLRALNGEAPLHTVLAVDAQLADEYAGAVHTLLKKSQMTPAQVAGIGLHGQTIWHAPQATPPVTCQIGDPSRLAEATGIQVVADFRQRDMAAGGQGAPLAPYFHAQLFGTDQPRVVLNLGGIANITVLNRNAQAVRGFDCGPANTLLDAWIAQQHGNAFDDQGAWAASGQVDETLLHALLQDHYFERLPPKSTGPEYFNLDWLARHFTDNIQAQDVQTTLAELTARTVAQSIQRWGDRPETVIVCGGGSRNKDLIERIKSQLMPTPVMISDQLGWPAEQIEAIGFAYLARATLLGEAVDLTAITGARRPVILGGIYSA